MKRETNQQRSKKVAKRLAAYSAAAAATVVAAQGTANAAEVVHDIPDVTFTSLGLNFNIVTGATSAATASTGNTTPTVLRVGTFPNYWDDDIAIQGPAQSTGVAFVGTGGIGAVYASVSVLGFGSTVGASRTFAANNAYPSYGMYAFVSNFIDTRGFVGLRFNFSGNTHYGWADLSVVPGPNAGDGINTTGPFATLHAFGFNDTPGAPSVIPIPNCDFEPDGDCDIDDVDALTLVGDLETGVAVPPADAKFDITGNSIVNQEDLATWLGAAAATNGHASPYRPGDNDLDRDVDITDFNNFATNFDPGGSNSGNKFSVGDGDGDGDVDITDFNVLASGFAPGGYDDAEATVAADADPGQVDLIVDLANGEVTLDGNAAAISGLQIFSAGNSLVAADFTADVLQFVISTNTSTYAEGAFVNTGVDGEISLGVLYDLLVDARDVAFEYTMIGQPTVQGVVNYIPEPSSILLLGAGAAGFIGWRRRRDR